MSNEDLRNYKSLKRKIEYYNELRREIGKDGKSHSCMRTKDGVVIDGKLYPYEKKKTPTIKKRM
jgi:hypothetical protein